MVLFPNIVPYDSLGAVATMGSRHFVPMTEIEPAKEERYLGRIGRSIWLTSYAPIGVAAFLIRLL